MMTKNDTISAIIRINHTADPSFLAEFSNDQLDQYLCRLTAVSDARHPSKRSRPDEPGLAPAPMLRRV